MKTETEDPKTEQMKPGHWPTVPGQGNPEPPKPNPLDPKAAKEYEKSQQDQGKKAAPNKSFGKAKRR